MALHARTAASLAILAAMLASPPAVAAGTPAADAKPKKARAAQQGPRPQGSSVGAARGAGGADQAEGSQVAGDPNAIVRWEDEDGGIHYTHAYEVPQRYRPKVRSVTTTIGTVPMERVETGKAPAASQGPAAPAAQPATSSTPGAPPPATTSPQGAAPPATTSPPGAPPPATTPPQGAVPPAAASPQGAVPPPADATQRAPYAAPQEPAKR